MKKWSFRPIQMGSKPFGWVGNLMASKTWRQPWPPKNMKWPPKKYEGFRVPLFCLQQQRTDNSHATNKTNQRQPQNTSHRTTLPSAFFCGSIYLRVILSIDWSRYPPNREIFFGHSTDESFVQRETSRASDLSSSVIGPMGISLLRSSTDGHRLPICYLSIKMHSRASSLSRNPL